MLHYYQEQVVLISEISVKKLKHVTSCESQILAFCPDISLIFWVEGWSLKGITKWNCIPRHYSPAKLYLGKWLRWSHCKMQNLKRSLDFGLYNIFVFVLLLSRWNKNYIAWQILSQCLKSPCVLSISITPYLFSFSKSLTWGPICHFAAFLHSCLRTGALLTPASHQALQLLPCCRESNWKCTILNLTICPMRKNA